MVPEAWCSTATDTLIKASSTEPSSSQFPCGRLLAYESLPEELDPRLLEASKQVMFQGNPARLHYEETMPDSERVFASPHFTYRLIFERSRTWYTLAYCGNRDMDEVPPIVMQYFATFRIEPKKNVDRREH